MPAEDEDNFTDSELDRLLTRHVTEELQPHIGASAVRFLMARKEARRRWIVPLSLAALVLLGLGAAVKFHAMQEASGPKIVSNVSNIKPTAPSITASMQPRIDSDLFSRTSEIGDFEIDGQPTRAYKTELIQSTQTYDPKTQITTQTTVPSEQIVFVTLKQY